MGGEPSPPDPKTYYEVSTVKALAREQTQIQKGISCTEDGLRNQRGKMTSQLLVLGPVDGPLEKNKLDSHLILKPEYIPKGSMV